MHKIYLLFKQILSNVPVVRSVAGALRGIGNYLNRFKNLRIVPGCQYNNIYLSKEINILFGRG